MSSTVALFPITLTATAAMVVTSLVMVLTPGPNMMYLVSRSVGQGRRAGLVSLAGTGVGFVVYLLMANLGLAVVFVAVPWLFIGLKTVGVAYLAYLAWQAFRPGGRGVFEVADLPKDGSVRLFSMGVITNLLNPKAAIMYLTLIPQFIDADRGHRFAQGMTLGALQITVSMIVNASIVVAAGAVAGLFTRSPTWALWQRRVTGTLLGCVAIALAREVPARARV